MWQFPPYFLLIEQTIFATKFDKYSGTLATAIHIANIDCDERKSIIGKYSIYFETKGRIHYIWGGTSTSFPVFPSSFRISSFYFYFSLHLHCFVFENTT